MKTVLITSSILIVLIVALRPILRGRIDPRIQYALWLMVALRLLVPVNFVESTHSVLAMLDRVERPAQIVEDIGQTTIPVRSYNSARTQVLEEYRRQGIEEAALTPSDLIRVDSQTQELMRGPTLAEIAAKYARPVWLGGAAVMAAWFLLVNLRLRWRLRGAEFVEADCPLPVYVSDALPSPCLIGVVRPSVCVTLTALESEDRLRHVLAHELTHYRHRDHWWALVRCLCLCVYWFNPLVWWAAALSRQDCELACDEGAIRLLGEGERLPYGRTLVDMIAAGRTSLLQTATTMTGGKRRVRERIKLIARKPKTAVAVALGLVLIVGCAVGCTFTGAPETPAGSDESRQPGGAQALNLGLTTDNLQERLKDVPEELCGDVAAVWYPGDNFMVEYWMNRDWSGQSTDSPFRANAMGLLLRIYKMPESDLDSYFTPSNGQWEVIARCGDACYAIYWTTKIRCPEEEAGVCQKAFEDIRAYVEQQVLDTEDVEPFDPEAMDDAQRTIHAVMEEIAYAPGTSMVLYQPETVEGSPAYNIDTPPDEYWSQRLILFATEFGWEELNQEQAAAVMEQGSGVSLMLAPSGAASSACITVYEGSPLVAVRTLDNEMKWYQAKSLYGEEPPLGTFILNPGTFEFLRDWFDQTELASLRVTAVPDRGQSHQEVVAEWIGGYEGAFTECTPGSQFACTQVWADDIKADIPDWMTDEQLEAFAQDYGLAGADFGKTWFGFSYSLIFEPENENARNYMMAGNTTNYTGSGASERSLIFSRLGIMRLIDGKWTCEGTGTGW